MTSMLLPAAILFSSSPHRQHFPPTQVVLQPHNRSTWAGDPPASFRIERVREDSMPTCFSLLARASVAVVVFLMRAVCAVFFGVD